MEIFEYTIKKPYRYILCKSWFNQISPSVTWKQIWAYLDLKFNKLNVFRCPSNTLRKSLHILVCFMIVSIKAIHGSPYVPGEPGGAWTMEELLIVKAKLYAVFNQPHHLGGVLPPKFLRLGFHDCLKLVAYQNSFN